MTRVLVFLLALLAAPPVAAQDDALVEALRGGGHTLYFRHAATDWTQSDRVSRAGDWTSCDGARMRQLSDQGRAAAARIGAAIKALGIPIGEIRTSPYCRAVDTAKAMDLGPVTPTEAIMNMRAADFVGGPDAVVARLRRILATPPPDGTNRLIAAHGNLMRAATGTYAAEGGAAIFAADPGAEHGFRLVAEVAPEDWAALAE